MTTYTPASGQGIERLEPPRWDADGDPTEIGLGSPDVRGALRGALRCLDAQTAALYLLDGGTGLRLVAEIGLHCPQECALSAVERLVEQTIDGGGEGSVSDWNPEARKEGCDRCGPAFAGAIFWHHYLLGAWVAFRREGAPKFTECDRSLAQQVISNSSICQRLVARGSLISDGANDALPAVREGSTGALLRALEAEVISVRQLCAVPIELNILGEVRELEAAVAHHLFRIAQAAIANGIERSRAATLRVGLLFEGKYLTVIVQDAGGGYDRPRRCSDAHDGLPAMERRAAAIGATLDYEAQPGWGAQLRVVAPLTCSMTATPRTVRVVIVAGGEISRAGIAGMLVAGDARIAVAAEVAAYAQAIELLDTAQPDVLVVQIASGQSIWEPSLAALCHAAPEVAVLLIGGDRCDGIQARAVRAGAVGWLSQACGRRELADAVLAAADRCAIAPGRDVYFLGRRGAPESPALTVREREVLDLLRQGRRDRQIAQSLLISVKTVEKHVGSLLRKTSAQNRTELVSRLLV